MSLTVNNSSTGAASASASFSYMGGTVNPNETTQQASASMTNEIDGNNVTSQELAAAVGGDTSVASTDSTGMEYDANGDTVGFDATKATASTQGVDPTAQNQLAMDMRAAQTDGFSMSGGHNSEQLQALRAA